MAGGTKANVTYLPEDELEHPTSSGTEEANASPAIEKGTSGFCIVDVKEEPSCQKQRKTDSVGEGRAGTTAPPATLNRISRRSSPKQTPLNSNGRKDRKLGERQARNKRFSVTGNAK